MPSSKHTYMGGMDKDSSKSKFRPDKYYDALNVRVMTNDGLSTGSIENEKGNALSFTIPSTQSIYRIRRVDETAAPATNQTFFNGVYAGYDASDNIQTTEDLLAYWNTNTVIQNLVQNSTIQLYEDAAYIYVVGLDAGILITQSGTDLEIVELVPAQSNLKIIGMDRLRDTIVVITTNETVAEPTSSYGQIWAINYDEFKNIATNLTNGALTPSVHLKYNNKLNLSTYNRIGEIVGRYENAKTGRIYFCDNYNPLRTLNIFNDENFIIPPGDLDIVSNVSLTLPKLNSIGAGSIPVGSMVQYGYRLLNSTTGNETIISPLSRVIPLTGQDPNTSIYNGESGSGTEFRGSSSTGSLARSVTWEVENIDENYDVIEHFAVLWSTSVNNPLIVKFGEDVIPSDGNLTVTYDGTEDVIDITPQEFNLLNNSFIAKTITSKDNNLVAANIKEKRSDIDFDARAYRFKANQSSTTVFNKDNQPLTITTTNWASVAEDHDVINPFNQDDPDINSDWYTNDQYKYQPNSTVLGGAGPNISYKFTEFETEGCTNLGLTTSQHVSVGRYLPSDTFTLGETNADGTSIEYPIGTEQQFKNMASPFVHAIYKGHARGEVYRYGITFFDKKGNPMYVKWIGDIKFPEAYEGFPLFRNDSGTAINKQLGIEFTVDISSIKDKISGFSIVRVQREEEDKTRLGTGILTMWDWIKQPYLSFNTWSYNFFGSPDGRLESKIDGIFNSNNQEIVHPMDRPGFSRFHLDYILNKGLVTFHSPLGVFDESNYKFKSRDHIRTIGYLTGTPYVGYSDDPSGTRHLQGFWKMENFFSITDTTNIPGASFSGVPGYNPFPDTGAFLINAQRIMQQGEALNTNNSLFNIGSIQGKDYVVNAYGGRANNPDDQKILGIGAKKQILILNDDATANDWWYSARWLKYWGGVSHSDDQAVSLLENDTTGNAPNWFKCVSYCRFIRKQYGGNDYFSRSKNTYISTGHYQSISEISADSHTFKVFGGDVFVNFYDDEYIGPYYNKTQAIGEPYHEPRNSKIGFALAFPCEMSINTELRSGRHWAADRDYSSPGSYENDTHELLSLYTQENNAKTQFVAKDPLTSEFEEHSHEIRVSEPKIDGELIDNWRIFKQLNKIEVEGIHGEINKIINLKGTVYFFQDSATGAVTINERVSVPSETGAEIVIGNGDVIDDYAYLNTKSGTKHQHSVVASFNTIYYWDTRLKKMMQLGGTSPQPISDLKGLSAYLTKFDGLMEDVDLTLDRLDESAGVHGVFDPRHQRVIFTFRAATKYTTVQANTTYQEGDIILYNGIYYIAQEEIIVEEIPQLPSDDNRWQPQIDKSGNPTFINGFTISYSEFMQAFESFHSYVPRMYFNADRRLLSVNPYKDGEVWEHEQGIYGNFYGKQFNSTINVLLNPGGDIVKVFDNLEYNSEIYINNIDQPSETLDLIRWYNEYQDTGKIQLIVNDNVRRRIRTWRHTVPKISGARIRNPYVFLELSLVNNNDKRLILHDLTIHFRASNM